MRLPWRKYNLNKRVTINSWSYKFHCNWIIMKGNNNNINNEEKFNHIYTKQWNDKKVHFHILCSNTIFLSVADCCSFTMQMNKTRFHLTWGVCVCAFFLLFFPLRQVKWNKTDTSKTKTNYQSCVEWKRASISFNLSDYNQIGTLQFHFDHDIDFCSTNWTRKLAPQTPHFVRIFHIFFCNNTIYVKILF